MTVFQRYSLPVRARQIIANRCGNNIFSKSTTLNAARLLVLTSHILRLKHPLPISTVQSVQYHRKVCSDSIVLSALSDLHRLTELEDSYVWPIVALGRSTETSDCPKMVALRSFWSPCRRSLHQSRPADLPSLSGETPTTWVMRISIVQCNADRTCLVSVAEAAFESGINCSSCGVRLGHTLDVGHAITVQPGVSAAEFNNL